MFLKYFNNINFMGQQGPTPKRWPQVRLWEWSNLGLKQAIPLRVALKVRLDKTYHITLSLATKRANFKSTSVESLTVLILSLSPNTGYLVWYYFLLLSRAQHWWGDRYSLLLTMTIYVAVVSYYNNKTKN